MPDWGLGPAGAFFRKNAGVTDGTNADEPRGLILIAVRKRAKLCVLPTIGDFSSATTVRAKGAEFAS